MTIYQDSVIEASDLLSMNAAALATLAANNLYKPTQVLYTVHFPNVLSATDGYIATSSVVLTDDFILSEVAVEVGNASGSTFTVDIDSGALIEPISMTATSDSSYYKFPRYYGLGVLATGKPVQVLLKGTTLDIAVTSNKASAGPHVVIVTLCLQSKLRRF